MAVRELPTLADADLPPGCAFGCIIDVETTGFSAEKDRIVELGILLFAYDPDTGRVLGIVDEYVGLQDPGRKIPKAAQKVHGITDADVKGKQLDRERIESILSRAQFVAAHNARYDLSFVGREFPAARDKPWYCSLYGIDWYGRGHESRRLNALLEAHRIPVLVYHRGLADARALLQLLSLPGPNGHTNLKEMLKSAPITYKEPVPGGRKERSKIEEDLTSYSVEEEIKIELPLRVRVRRAPKRPEGEPQPMESEPVAPPPKGQQATPSGCLTQAVLLLILVGLLWAILIR